MGFRTLEISNPAELHVATGQLSIEQETGKVVIPLEDLTTIVCIGANIRLSTLGITNTIRRKWSIVQLKLNEKNDDNKEIKSVEHFSSLFYVENNKPALATFTVKVTNNAGRKIYTIELMELKKVEGKVQGKVQKLHQATSTFDTLNISQIADKINRASKVVGYTIR